MGRWDAGEAERLGLNPQEILAFFYAADVETIAQENAPPHGELLLAVIADGVAGCAAFRQIDPNTCELHHVYVRDEFRRLRIGHQLVDRLVAAARGAGYKTMLLETTTFMPEAHALYTSIGFKRRGPYYAVPTDFEPFTVFMELSLVPPNG
jgi:putative acetyltransferase